MKENDIIDGHASLESINLLMDDRLMPTSSSQSKKTSGSLDSLRNYLSSSPSSICSDNVNQLSATEFKEGRRQKLF